jgi:hypothetical protein
MADLLGGVLWRGGIQDGWQAPVPDLPYTD